MRDWLQRWIGDRRRARAVLEYSKENGTLFVAFVLLSFVSEVDASEPFHLGLFRMSMCLTQSLTAGVLIVNHSELVGQAASTPAVLGTVFAVSASVTLAAFISSEQPFSAILDWQSYL